MAEVDNSRYCRQCGNAVQEGDTFCGNCGSAILSPPEEAEQMIPREKAASQSATAPNRSRRAVWVVGFCALMVLLVGGGALAAAFSDRLGLLGGTTSDASGSGGSQSPKPERLAVGDAVVAEDLEVILNSVRQIPSTDFQQPEGGNVYLGFDLTFENTSEAPKVVAANDFSLQDRDGNPGEYRLHTEVEALEEGELGAREEMSGEMVFEVPVYSQGLELLYEPTGGDGAYAWFVGGAADLQSSGRPPQEESTEPEPETPSVASDSPPDPAFDELLPVLGQTTSAPVMLPAELPSGLENVAVDADLEGEEYGILFLYDPPENVVESFSGAGTLGTLEVSPEPESLSNEYFEATSVETFELPEGTEATLRYMEPVTAGGTDGPYWEGKFDRQGYTYTLIVTNPGEISEEGARQVLSTMVEAPDSNTGIADGLGATESASLAARVDEGEANDD